MLFSVLIPNRGYKESFRKCIQSIKNQEIDKSFSYELIICDQSEPEDRTMIKKALDDIVGENNYQFIQSEERGVLVSRHKLLKEANGDYIVFIDSDDYVENSYFKNIYNFLNNHNYPDIFIHNFLFDDGGEIRPNILPPQINDHIKDYFFFSDLLNPVVTKTFKRNLYNVADYTDFTTQNGDDWVLSYPIMKKAKTIVSDFSFFGYFYQINNDSVTHKISIETAKRTLSFRVGYDEFENINELQNRILTKHYIGTFNHLFRSIVSNCEKNMLKLSFIRFSRYLIIDIFGCKRRDLLTRKEKISYFLLKIRFYRILHLLFKIIK